MPSESSGKLALLDRLAEEFAERYRKGERPSLAEYVERHPELADDIRELFPALAQVEQAEQLRDGAPSPGPAAPLVRVGDYRILREVGRGGMGVVYEAEQVSLGRRVALKVLPPGALIDAHQVERFSREAKAAARLHHTNIVPVYGVGEQDGLHYYAMQFIQGHGLDVVLADVRRMRESGGPPTVACPPPGGVSPSVARGLLTGEFVPHEGSVCGAASDSATTPLPTRPAGDPHPSALSGVRTEGEYYRSVARVGMQAAEALAYAHNQGVLHRDVKPSNLLLDVHGAVWVTDFGLAKADGHEDLTRTGDVVGTLRFLAPERFDGQSLPQGDVYGLGLTLYEMLTLRPAYEDSNRARLVERMVREDPVRPRRIDPRIPHDLETIVLKAIARDPRARYATAEAMADDLRRFLADLPVRARRVSWPEHAWRWCRRNPAVASLSAALLVLLAMILAGSLVAAFVFLEQRDEALREKKRAQDYYEALEFTRTVFPEPQNLLGFRGKEGRVYHFRVTGAPASGPVVGTGAYADDSSLAAAAVHAGAVRAGETGYVRVTMLPNPVVFRGTVRNGVISQTVVRREPISAFRVQPVDQDGKPVDVPVPITPASGERPLVTVFPGGSDVTPFRGRNGESFVVELVGDGSGEGPFYVWGTDVYTDDSNLARAAVHAGVLREGQRGVVKVTILPGRDSYEGSARNGVVSRPYGAWLGSYRVEAAGPGAKPAGPESEPRPESVIQPPADGTLSGFRDLTGQSFDFEVVGEPGAQNVFGTGVYADDSRLAAAAVHAGAVEVGKRGYVRVTILPNEVVYAGTVRNGVTSETVARRKDCGGFRVQPLDRSGKPVDAPAAPRPLDGPIRLPASGSLADFRDLHDRSFFFEVTGDATANEAVEGDGVYADRSWLAKAAVHAGVLRHRQKGVVKVTILPSRESYEASTRNGVTTESGRPCPGSYRVEPAEQFGKPVAVTLAPSEVPLPDPGTLANLKVRAGYRFHFEVVGSAEATPVYGTDVYTDDSVLAAAAVHAGVLRDGEKGVVRITVLPGQARYEGSRRNGVASLPYGPWTGSYRIEAVKP